MFAKGKDVHDNGAWPDIHGFAVGKTIEYLWCHEEHSSAFAGRSFGVEEVQFGTQSEICHFQSSEIVGWWNKYILRLNVPVDNIHGMNVIEAPENWAHDGRHLLVIEFIARTPSVFDHFF